MSRAATVGVAAPARISRTARPERTRQGRTTGRDAILGSVIWIAVVATLLAGIVAVNVAALQLNIGLDRLTRERDRLRAENAVLAAEVATAAGPRVQALARSQLGLLPADPIYVGLERGKQ